MGDDPFKAREAARQIAGQLDDIRDELVEGGVDPSTVRSMQFTGGQHTGYIKNADGEIEYTEPLDRDGWTVLLHPRWEPEWPPVQPADPVTIRPSRSKPRRDDIVRTFIWPDPQCGWWINHDLQVAQPMHDPAAIAAAAALAKHLKPDVQVNIGDFLDLASAGKYRQHRGFQLVMQSEVNTGHRLLAMQRALAPWSTIRLHEGNHDDRIAKVIAANYMDALHIRRADAPDGWPVMSVPNLLALDDLDVEYVGGYPSDRTWVTPPGSDDPLRVLHGEVASKHTAAKVLDDERVSTIQGHIHRFEERWRTVDVGHGVARQIMAASPGCLCRIDGAVPSQKTGVDPKTAMPIRRVVDWQQGCGWVDVYPDGTWSYEAVRIIDGTARWRGRTFVGAPEHVELLSDHAPWP